MAKSYKISLGGGSLSRKRYLVGSWLYERKCSLLCESTGAALAVTFSGATHAGAAREVDMS